MKNLALTAAVVVLAACKGGSGNAPDTITTIVPNDPPTTATQYPTVTITPSADWTLVWQDEFDGSEINLEKWQFEQNCYGGGNNEQQCYTNRADNAYIEQGNLVIKAIKGDYTGPAAQDDAPDYDINQTRTLPYTSARLRSKNLGDWQYGRFEIKAKLPFGQGTWPAIWMLPTDWVYGGWAASGEIDIMEAVNLGTKSDEAGYAPKPEVRVHGTLHYGAPWPNNVYSGTGFRLPNDADPSQDFHVYAVEWEKDEIRWYVDDIHYATQTSTTWYNQYTDSNGSLVTGTEDAPFNQRFHLILNLAVGGAWAANVNEKNIDANVFPQTLIIDYVRVYQCSLDTVTGLGCGASSDQAIIVTK